MKDSLFAAKKAVWVFTTLAECPLKHSEVVIYSYLAYQHRYDSVPNLKQTVKATGFGFRCVRAAIESLTERGALDAEGAVKPPPDGWFKMKHEDTIKSHSHFSTHYTHWTCYVRKHKSALSNLTLAVYCFIRHCAVTDYTPEVGWSKSYLAVVLRCKRETVGDCLLLLKDAGLLAWDSDLNFTLFKLTTTHMNCFADKEQQRPKPQPKVVLSEQFSEKAFSNWEHPEIPTAPPPTRDDLIKLLRRGGIAEKAEEYADTIIASTDWEGDGETVTLHIGNRLMAYPQNKAAKVMEQIISEAKDGKLRGRA